MALVELRLDLFDRVLERGVPGRPTQAIFHVLARLGGRRQAATEQAAEAPRELRPDTQRARLEARPIAVPALVAVEFELIARVVAVIAVVTREHDARHSSESI